jgi:hypothetical protein
MLPDIVAISAGYAPHNNKTGALSRALENGAEPAATTIARR